MAFWLIACKEINGKIYVTRLNKATNDHTPGIPDQWYYVGPGSRPFVQNYDGANQFILVFDYMSHLVARVFDISTWPPTQVDPITTNPISIGAGNPPQGPDDALFVRFASTVASANASVYLPPPQIQAGHIIYDGVSQYSVTITLANGWSSGVPGTNYYRVYRQPITGGNWSMVQDWVAAPLSYTDTTTGSLRFNYRVTLGYDYDPNDPNNPLAHAESAPGNTLAKDSTTDSLDYQPSLIDSVSWSSNALQSTAYAGFGTRQQYLVEAVFDDVSYKFVAEEASQAVYNVDATRKDFVVAPDSTETISFKSSGVQGQAKLSTSARIDQ